MACQFFQGFECELDIDIIKRGRIEGAQIVEVAECRNIIINTLEGHDRETD